MKIITVSDIHLKLSGQRHEDSKLERFLSFLEKLRGNCDLLVLNGDIFDIWFVWKQVIIKRYFPVYRALADLRESGTRLIYISGNHDFWFRDFLSNNLGIEIHRDYFEIEADGRKMFFSHGDLFTTNDLRYKLFRYLVRKRIIMWLFGILHPDLALNLGMSLSRSSRKKKIPVRISARRERGLELFAEKNRDKYDLMILGHSHNPKIINFKDLTYVNSGDWINHYSYVEIDSGNALLKFYSKTEQKEKL